MKGDIRAVSRTVLALRMARRGDHANATATAAFQLHRLKQLVEHAYANVPFYRRKLDLAGVLPRHIRTLHDLHLIPITTRAELQNCAVADVVTRGVKTRSLKIHKTSGSTGEPMIIRRTWLEERSLGTLRAADLASYGINSSHRIASLVRGGPLKDPESPLMVAASRVFGRVAPIGISFFLPNDEIITRLADAKPEVITGYPTVLAQLADAIGRSGNPAIRPRIIISGAEVLTAEQRCRIEAAFGAQVYDKYGAHECGRVASQCPSSSSFHVCGTGVIAEVLRDGRNAEPGEEGEIATTSLHSFAMPFIRYQLGDVVRAGDKQCECGAGFSTIRAIHGRTHDYFTVADGRRMHLYAMTDAFHMTSSAWMRSFRLNQVSANRLVLTITPSGPVPAGDLADIRERVRAIVGHGTEFTIEVTPPRDPSLETPTLPA